MVSIPSKKKPLHSILVENLSNLTINPSTSSPSSQDFDFADVFGPNQYHRDNDNHYQQQQPEVILSRTHSFVGPSPRFRTNPEPFDRVILDDAESGDDDEEEEVEVVETVEAIERKMGPMDFEILRVIGQGSFGKVFQVKKKRNGGGGEGEEVEVEDGVFAMKVMRKDVIIKKNHVDYMKAERDILTKVEHPFIVQLRYSFQV